MTNRDALVRQWREAKATVINYEGGRLDDSSPYLPGRRLIVEIDGKEEQVMDTCESPWCEGTANVVFEDVDRHQRPMRIFERGFGLGIMADFILRRAISIGCVDYHIAELNQTIAMNAHAWREARLRGIEMLSAGLAATSLDISITIHEGDAFEVTRRLVEQGNKFDVVIADTYPLKGEQGVNDLVDLDNSKKLLKPDGIFSFFAYTPSVAGGGLSSVQRDKINEHFREYAVIDSDLVTPPREYIYLWQAGKPVRRLTVMKAKKPRFSE